MKLFVTLLGFALSYVTHADVSVDGDAVERLAAALENSGAVASCGSGVCEMEASDVQCTLEGNAINQRNYDCVLTLRDEAGKATITSIIGPRAHALFDALTRAGVDTDCGMGTCGVEAKHILVTIEGNSVGARTFKAQIEP